MKTIILGVEYHIVPDPDRNCRSSVICRFHGERRQQTLKCAHPDYTLPDSDMSCMEFPGHIYILDEDIPEHVAGMLKDSP